MIPREGKWFLLAICTFSLIVEVKLQGERTYDTSEWIPITPTPLQTNSSDVAEQKTASDRVLSLDAPAQKFFPDEEYEYRKRVPNQLQSFVRESPPRKEFEDPRPRKLKLASEYKFETPPPPPSKTQPQINYYNGENISPYLFKQPQRASKPIQPEQIDQNYYVPVHQLPNQTPNSYVAVPSVNPQAPKPDAPNIYEQYQLPFNASFYQSLNPSSINNDFYQASSNGSQYIQQNKPIIHTQHKLERIISTPAPLPKPDIEQETVQLVYVPIENLKPNALSTQGSKSTYQQIHKPKQEKTPLQVNPPQLNQVHLTLEQPKQQTYSFNSPVESQEFVYNQANDPPREKVVATAEPVDNKQVRLERIQQDFIQQALQAHKLQQQLRDDINPLKQEIITTTEKPKQRPHQPPLAVFLESQKKAEIPDVLNILKGVKIISVQDKVTPDSPQIFVGPSNLDSPDGYTKFPLPYLNNINGNRIERKIDQLPFFLAPVSYKAPPGYSKISLPSPHVGSVVVSVPIASTTPEPVLLDENQLNPFTFSPSVYGPLSAPRSSRPQQNILESYDILEPSRGQYQSTPSPHIPESPLISPVRNIFENDFTPGQPDVYYTQQQDSNQQTYKDDVPTLDIYRPQIQKQQRYPSREEIHKIPLSTVRPKQNSREESQLPDINPLELAINEFELHQINDQFEEHNKVKHSTTRRPQTSYDDKQRTSNTRTPHSRGRPTYENEQTTERTASRGRVRGRGRGSTSKTTTTTTTSAPIETGRYTVLEEFAAKEPSRSPSTESYREFSTEAKAVPPVSYFPTPSFDDSPYLSEDKFESTLSQSDFVGSRSRDFDDSRSQIHFENSKTKTYEPPKTKPLSSVEAPKPQTVQEPNNYYLGSTEIENNPTNIYNLGQPQAYESADFDSPRKPITSTKLEYENIQQSKKENINIPSAERPKLEESTPTHNNRFTPEVFSYENREPNQRRPQERPINQQYDIKINDEPDLKQLYQTELYERPPTKLREQSNEEQSPKQQQSADPSGFIDNLFQPNFDQAYLSLQDQAVRSLLVPNLLAPSIKPNSPSTSTTKVVVSTTERIIEIPPSTEADITSTTRGTRTRGRGRARPTTASSESSVPRRPSSRRRPGSRTSSERTSANNEYSSSEENGRSEPNIRQRSRTRSRPNQGEISDRIFTTENDIRIFKEPTTEGSFEVLKSREPPQSYIQFEHAVNEEQIITINPNINQEHESKEYHQVYSLPQQTTTENQQIVLEYENTKIRPTPILDMQVSHVVPEENQQKPEILSKSIEEETYLKYNNANIKSGGVLNNNKPEPTTRSPTTKTRGRTRGRSRFATTTSTIKPVTRISTRPTSAPVRATTEKEEFFGFTRQPSYAPSNLNIQSVRENPSNPRNDESSIQFIGEIRPKYSASTTTPQPIEELDIIETPRPKIRARTRAPARKTPSNYRQLETDVHNARGSEQVTRRSGTPSRARGRGTSHYRAPENVKRESDDEDVANQNYPANFLQKLDVSSPKSTTAPFQITIDPFDEETDDQSPHSSIYRPKFVPNPNEWVDPNGLSSKEKSSSFKFNEFEVIRTSEKPQALAFEQATPISEQLLTEFTESEVDEVIADLEKIKTSPVEHAETTLNPTEQPVTKNKNKRRGVWKLVKHRPADPLEVSESQNYETVLNAFGSIQKIDPFSGNSGKSNGYKYSIKELSNSNNFQQEINSLSLNKNSNDNFRQEAIEDVVTLATNTENLNTEPTTEINVEELITTTPSAIKTQENIFDTIYEMFGIFQKPGKKNNETTSIENVISDVPTTTEVNPTFPDEITEMITTEKFDENMKTNMEISENNKNSQDKSEEKTSNDNLETTESTLPTSLVTRPSTKPYEVEPWEMRAVKTSTSTEVSHETEICYKGRCVKSRDKKKHK